MLLMFGLGMHVIVSKKLYDYVLGWLGLSRSAIQLGLHFVHTWQWAGRVGKLSANIIQPFLVFLGMKYICFDRIRARLVAQIAHIGKAMILV